MPDPLPGAPPAVLLCMGTRPEIIKMAPVYHALVGGPLRPVVVHTGQHEAVAWSLYRFFGMAPDHALDLRRERPSLGHLSAQLLDGLDGILGAERARAVLVHGDTSSALAAALAAFYAGVPVGHVEAGLRSGDPANPFPEEMNRTLIARLARWHFAPTSGAARNLLREGVAPSAVLPVGNTIVDAVGLGLGALAGPGATPRALEGLGAWSRGKRLALVTMHRREHWSGPIEDVARAVAESARLHDLRVLWPVHPNPRVADAVRAGLAAVPTDRVRLVEPLDYPAMLWALRRAWVVLTDSGGVQEEAAALGRPVLVLRHTTERPELVEAGGGALVGPSGAAVRAWLRDLVTQPARYAALRSAENPYGDGRTGERIAAVLAREVAGAHVEAPAAFPLPTVAPLRLATPALWPSSAQPAA